MKQFDEIYNIFKQAQLKAFEGKNVPDWMKNHPAFKNKERVEKVFKAFGLNNFREKVEYTKSSKKMIEFEKIIIGDLKIEMEEELTKLYLLLRKYAEVLDTENFMTEDEKILNKIDQIYKLHDWIKNLKDFLYTSVYFEKDEQNNPKLTWSGSFDFDGRRILSKGESVFKSFGKINNFVEKYFIKYDLNLSILTKLKLPSIDNLSAAKQYHSLTRRGNNYEVAFSAEGDEGTWDICTMSMRGIESCQSWDDKTGHSRSLISSILSKYIGVIYLTNNSQMEHGSRMIARCVVGFALRYTDKQPKIVIGPMYPMYDAEIYNLFKQSLEKHTKVPIVNSISMSPEDDEAVFTPPEEEMSKLHEQERSYFYKEPTIKERFTDPKFRK